MKPSPLANKFIIKVNALLEKRRTANEYDRKQSVFRNHDMFNAISSILSTLNELDEICPKKCSGLFHNEIVNGVLGSLHNDQSCLSQGQLDKLGSLEYMDPNFQQSISDCLDSIEMSYSIKSLNLDLPDKKLKAKIHFHTMMSKVFFVWLSECDEHYVNDINKYNESIQFCVREDRMNKKILFYPFNSFFNMVQIFTYFTPTNIGHIQKIYEFLESLIIKYNCVSTLSLEKVKDIPLSIEENRILNAIYTMMSEKEKYMDFSSKFDNIFTSLYKIENYLDFCDKSEFNNYITNNVLKCLKIDDFTRHYLKYIEHFEDRSQRVIYECFDALNVNIQTNDWNYFQIYGPHANSKSYKFQTFLLKIHFKVMFLKIFITWQNDSNSNVHDWQTYNDLIRSYETDPTMFLQFSPNRPNYEYMTCIFDLILPERRKDYTSLTCDKKNKFIEICKFMEKLVHTYTQ
jgi:hypothetical protein